MDDTKGQQRRGVRRLVHSSAGITLCTLLSTALGFATQVILASYFGTTEQMDAYLVSLTIPAMVVAVFGGSLNYTFIPVFVEKLSSGEESAAWRIVNDMFSISLMVLLPITLLSSLLAPDVIGATAPGLANATKGEAASFFRVQTPVIVFSGLSALLGSTYYARKRFLYPALAQVANSATILLVVSLFAKGFGIRAAAWGGLAGSALAFFMLVPVLRHIPRFRLSPFPLTQGTRRVIRLIMPLLCGALFYRGDDLIQRFIASSFTAGSISSLAYAFKLVTTCSSLVVSGISIVLLQHVSELASRKEEGEIGGTFGGTFRWLTFFMMLVISCAVVSGEDGIAVLFQRGKFDAASSHLTWQCLVLYAGVMYGGVIGAITTPVFYAYKDTMLVVKVGIAGALLQLAFSFLLSRIWSELGLPLAYSLSSLATISTFLAILNRKYVPLPLREMGRSLLTSGLAAAVAMPLLRHAENAFLPPLAPLARLAVMVPLTSLAYLTLAALLKNEEAMQAARGAAMMRLRKPARSILK
ncbi:MAG: hypothetical protein FPO08_07050 [Geobacter sp.]|nr:MAG: hypothetical protein FPO08_07050 [Geobacter sp.]